MTGELNQSFESQPLEKVADTRTGSDSNSPVGRWAKAEFLVCLTKAQMAAAEATEEPLCRYKGFFRALAFLVEQF